MTLVADPVWGARAGLAQPDPESAAELVATATDVHVERGRRPVLNGVSLALRAGTITVLLGPNGAGKSTLIKAFCGAVPLSGGAIRVAGHDPRLNRAARAAIGVVPQEIALYGKLTVRENLETFAALNGRTAGDRRGQIDAALERTGLSGSGHRLAGVLSGGLQRRANLASALIGNPRLLLLDEPSVGLDVTARAGIAAVLRGLAAETRCAILLTTHHVTEAEDLADLAVVIDAGCVVGAGPPKALIDRHFPVAARHVEAILAEPAEPLLAARLSKQGFTPAPDGLTWRALVPTAPERTLAMLEAMGTSERPWLREWRVRRPSLEDVYLKLLSRDQSA